jgi:preprotein translocase subunit YajC
LIKNKKFVWVVLALLVAIPLLFAGCIPTQTGASPTPGQSTGGFDWTYIIFILVIIAAFYFFMIRPQSSRKKQQQKLLDELKPGDLVITTAGIYGEIESIDQETAVIKVEGGTKLRIARGAIAGKRF